MNWWIDESHYPGPDQEFVVGMDLSSNSWMLMDDRGKVIMSSSIPPATLQNGDTLTFSFTTTLSST